MQQTSDLRTGPHHARKDLGAFEGHNCRADDRDNQLAPDHFGLLFLSVTPPPRQPVPEIFDLTKASYEHVVDRKRFDNALHIFKHLPPQGVVNRTFCHVDAT